MTQAGTDFTFSKTIANNTPLSIYFTYNTPPGGERNSSAKPHSYTVGTNCTGSTGTPPTVSLTAPANNASYTEPATITLTADATDADGTISTVEFYRGATLIDSDNTSPYSVTWSNAAAGNYTISAKATDNNGFSTISSLKNIVVNIDHSVGFCGTLANGDYSYRAEVVNGVVVFTFHPLGSVRGTTSALIYVREGATGGYPGYNMTQIGGDFRFSKNIATGTNLSIYFTYNVPGFGDRNSSATPHSYKVGTNCLATVPTDEVDEFLAFALYPNPVQNRLFIQFKQPVAQKFALTILNSVGQTVLSMPLSDWGKEINISPLASGIYFMRLTEEATKRSVTRKFVKEK
jgi:Bacterial Ig domain/Secretion system C-terminal sorting domain